MVAAFHVVNRLSWVVSMIGACMKDSNERVFGSMRDLLYITALFVAFKLDGMASYAWSVAFLVPWIWFGALFTAAILVCGKDMGAPSLPMLQQHLNMQHQVLMTV
eukprot:jgi/Chrzof1/5219/Cz15g17060.t1